MALIICSECGKEISDKSGACIGCGAPIQSSQIIKKPSTRPSFELPTKKAKKPWYKRVWVLVLIVFIGLALLSNIIEINDETPSESGDKSSSTSTPSPTPAPTPSPTPAPTPSPSPTPTPRPTLEEFQEIAESPSYEDLSRYPDTYKTTPIKITVKVKEVGVDKLLGLLEGGYLCTMDGKELAVFDNRELKEPKLLEGDKVIIYGYGSGLNELREKQQGLIVDKVVSERYIPEVKIEYVEIVK